MKAITKREVTVTLELNEEEATWLRDVLQNFPPSDTGIPTKTQHAMWSALTLALAEKKTENHV